MIISQILFIIFIIFLFYSYKSTVLIYTAFKLLFNITFVALNFGPVILTFNDLACLSIIIFFPFKINFNKPYNPLTISLLLYLTSLLLVSLFSLYASSILMTYKLIISDVVYPLIFWYFLKTQKDIKIVIRSYIFVFYIICIYGIIEFLLGHNPILEWLALNTTSRVFVDHINDIRFGFGRYSSFMFYPVSFGFVCAIFFSFILYYYKKYNNIILYINKMNFYLLLILLFIGVVLSNSRATIVCFLIGLMHSVNFSLLKNRKGLLIITIVLCIGAFMYDYIFMVIESIFIDKTDEIGGSSTNLRISQLTESLKYFMMSPIFGNGINYLTYIQDENYRELSGAESYWFILLIERGLVGIIAYLFMIKKLIFLLGKKHLSFSIIITLAWVVLTSMSLAIGIDISYLICLMLLIYKSDEILTLKLKFNKKFVKLRNQLILQYD